MPQLSNISITPPLEEKPLSQKEKAARLKGISHEAAQKTMWDLDFQELKHILTQSNRAPLPEDRVDWVINQAQAGHAEDAKKGKAVMPHFYVIQQLQGLGEQYFSSFIKRLRSRVQDKLVQSASPWNLPTDTKRF